MCKGLENNNKLQLNNQDDNYSVNGTYKSPNSIRKQPPLETYRIADIELILIPT